MARRRKSTNAPENIVPALIATSISPPTQPTGDTYEDLVSDGSIGIDSEQVSSGETPMVLNLMLMGG